MMSTTNILNHINVLVDCATNENIFRFFNDIGYTNEQNQYSTTSTK
jgi:hypothetical protein